MTAAEIVLQTTGPVTSWQNLNKTAISHGGARYTWGELERFDDAELLADEGFGFADHSYVLATGAAERLKLSVVPSGPPPLQRAKTLLDQHVQDNFNY